MKRISQRKLAQLAGVSQPYINKLIKNGILPLHDGYLDEDECLIILRNKTPDQTTNNNQDYAEFDKQYKNARAIKEARRAEIRGVDFKLKQLAIDIQMGKMLASDLLHKEVQEALVNFRLQLYTIPARVAMSCVGMKPDKIRQIVQDEINQTYLTLDNLVDSVKTMAKQS